MVTKTYQSIGRSAFAGLLGGTRQRKAYEAQKDAVDRHILGLGEEVLLFPGHGPATTVGEERAHNPFFHCLHKCIVIISPNDGNLPLFL